MAESMFVEKNNQHGGVDKKAFPDANRVKKVNINYERVVLIASVITTVEDFLKTDIARGKIIHCQFDSIYCDSSLLMNLKRCGVIAIQFRDKVIDVEKAPL